ncbi:sister chromatid cohesion protein PDS5 [Thiothrix subterranea]|uniref:sister chromatid cohesion protein PDS5 n=1 Tax=Thiothrix subterranea TaxID=2735563 RepID=UPI001D1863C5|nr:sister chromatid cohesion protein PDS5 [Thiothrix subterranea]
MLHDIEPEIRRIVAERIQPEALSALLDDPDWGVRLQAAERATRGMLEILEHDTDPDVKEVARQRLREMDDND